MLGQSIKSISLLYLLSTAYLSFWRGHFWRRNIDFPPHVYKLNTFVLVFSVHLCIYQLHTYLICLCYKFTWIRVILQGFQVRCSKYLYTIVIQDKDKAEKLKQSLPPGLQVKELKWNTERTLPHVVEMYNQSFSCTLCFCWK